MSKDIMKTQIESEVGVDGVRQAMLARDNFTIRLMRMLPFDMDEVNALAKDPKRIPSVLSQKLETTQDNRIRMIINGVSLYYQLLLRTMTEKPQ